MVEPQPQELAAAIRDAQRSPLVAELLATARERQEVEAAAARFREVVDFDAEAAEIRAMLENVMSDRLVGR